MKMDIIIIIFFRRCHHDDGAPGDVRAVFARLAQLEEAPLACAAHVAVKILGARRRAEAPAWVRARQAVALAAFGLEPGLRVVLARFARLAHAIGRGIRVALGVAVGNVGAYVGARRRRRGRRRV